MCFYAKSWVGSRLPVSQSQPLKPHRVVAHSSLPALGVWTQGSASSLRGGRAHLGTLLGPAAIPGRRGWGPHPVFQAARSWVGPSPLALHLGNGRYLTIVTATLACCTDLLTPNLSFFCSLKNSHGALNYIVPISPALPIHLTLLSNSTKMANVLCFHCRSTGCIHNAQTT